MSADVVLQILKVVISWLSPNTALTWREKQAGEAEKVFISLDDYTARRKLDVSALDLWRADSTAAHRHH